MANKHTLGPLTFSRARKPDNTGGYDYCIVDENNKIIGGTCGIASGLRRTWQ